jgi:hypothetical protein
MSFWKNGINGASVACFLPSTGAPLREFSEQMKRDNDLRSKADLKLWMALIIAAMAGAGSLAHAATTASATRDAPPVRDASRLKMGRFYYRDLDHGEAVGTATIAIRKISQTGNYRFSNEARLIETFQGFRSQRWQSTASADFAPIGAMLAFGSESQSVPSFELHYRKGRVSGFATDRSNADKMFRRSIDDAVPVDIVDQRIDWAAVMAADLVPGRSYQFNVYDPTTGVSSATERVGGRMNIRTPAGRFSTVQIVYDITKRGKLERYVAYATAQSPRFMVREEFPNGVVSELLKFDDDQGRAADD